MFESINYNNNNCENKFYGNKNRNSDSPSYRIDEKDNTSNKLSEKVQTRKDTKNKSLMYDLQEKWNQIEDNKNKRKSSTPSNFIDKNENEDVSRYFNNHKHNNSNTDNNHNISNNNNKSNIMHSSYLYQACNQEDSYFKNKNIQNHMKSDNNQRNNYNLRNKLQKEIESKNETNTTSKKSQSQSTRLRSIRDVVKEIVHTREQLDERDSFANFIISKEREMAKFKEKNKRIESDEAEVDIKQLNSSNKTVQNLYNIKKNFLSSTLDNEKDREDKSFNKSPLSYLVMESNSVRKKSSGEKLEGEPEPKKPQKDQKAKPSFLTLNQTVVTDKTSSTNRNKLFHFSNYKNENKLNDSLLHPKVQKGNDVNNTSFSSLNIKTAISKPTAPAITLKIPSSVGKI